MFRCIFSSTFFHNLHLYLKYIFIIHTQKRLINTSIQLILEIYTTYLLFLSYKSFVTAPFHIIKRKLLLQNTTSQSPHLYVTLSTTFVNLTYRIIYYSTKNREQDIMYTLFSVPPIFTILYKICYQSN